VGLVLALLAAPAQTPQHMLLQQQLVRQLLQRLLHLLMMVCMLMGTSHAATVAVQEQWQVSRQHPSSSSSQPHARRLQMHGAGSPTKTRSLHLLLLRMP
jgi:hypothetical protein